MLSDRMADALNKLDIRDAESIKQFKRTIRHLLEIFLRFTHRYWFHEVSDQPQAKELDRMTANFLGTDRLYTETRDEIEGMSEYLEGDTLRRQANTVVRLTVVTTFGLIGTVATGFLGMNLLALAESTFLEKLGYFFLVLIPTTVVSSTRSSSPSDCRTFSKRSRTNGCRLRPNSRLWSTSGELSATRDLPGDYPRLAASSRRMTDSSCARRRATSLI